MNERFTLSEKSSYVFNSNINLWFQEYEHKHETTEIPKKYIKINKRNLLKI